MRTGWGLCIWMTLCLVSCAGAGQPPALPYYPGAQVEVEALLTADDLLPFVIEPEDSGQQADGLLGGVTGLQVLQMVVAGPVDQQQVIGFYSRIPQSAGMKRVHKQYDRAGGVVLVWSGPKGDGLFGLRLAYVSDEPGAEPHLQLQVARLQGTLDVQALLKRAQVW